MTSAPTHSRTETTVTVIHPAYLNRFKCAGSACQDHCCYGWDIAVDRKTYENLGRSKNNEISGLFCKHVKKTAHPTEISYAKIQKINGRCAFLTGQRLCRIHLTLGERFLPDVCAAFPRHFKSRGRRMDMSASVSCPEIARLALDNPDGVHLIQTEYPASRLKRLGAPTRCESMPADPAAAAFTAFSIALIQNRRFALWERLLLYGILCKEASRLDTKGHRNGYDNLFETFAHHLQSGFFTTILENAPVMTGLQLQIIKRLTDEKAGSIQVKAFASRVAECFSGLAFNGPGRNIDGAQKIYDHAFQTYFAPFTTTHGYILENYLVNFVFSGGGLAGPGRGIYDQFLLTALHFAMIKTYLIGIAAFHRAPLTPDQAIRLIGAFTKTIEPDARFKSYALGLLEDNGCADVMNMAVLLKNEAGR
jgi:lysine-N-methylase